MYEGDRQLPDPRIVSARMSLDSDNSFASYDTALAHVTGSPLPPETNMFWEQGKLDVLFEYPIQAEKSYISHARRLRPPGAARNHHGSVSTAGRRCARLRIAGRCRIGEAGPQLVPRRGPVRGGGLPSHSGRHRPSIVFVLPGDSVPAYPSADPDRHRFHCGPFDHPDRLRLWICARCAVVPAPDRNADRDVDRLYGAREYSGRATEAALDHRFLLRPGTRLRFFFRSAQYPAVCRLACADFAFVLQCRRGIRAIVRSGYCSCRP